MKASYNPSVNIIRDTEKDFNYIPTPNGRRVVSQLVDDFKKGIRSFNIIGSYGTGKSSFLLALEQSLKKKKPYFDPNFVSNSKFEVLKIVGSYESIIDAFAEKLNVKAKQNNADHILSEIYNRYHDLGRKSPLLFIVIDEFGKFLEYAALNKPEQELYFVQQLAEFVNNTDYNIVLITTIHQSFESYAFSLADTQRQEWSKIKGRFKEIVFNEPVEQLLYLAAEHIESRFSEKASKKTLDASFKLFSKSKAFNHNESYSKEVNNRIYPLDITAANVLTLALQRYGQNERSLFSFLEATDFTSLEKFKSNTPFYGLPNVYDYLYFNLYSYLTSHHNPDFSSLGIIKRAIEEVERAFDTNIDAYLKLVKTIGLLNIFAAAGSTLDKAFLISYGNVCLGIANAEELIGKLEKEKIIFFRKHSKRYILFEGTDLDIHSALIEAANRVSEITDVSTLLRKYFDLAPVLAKQYYYQNGTPRYFEYHISAEPYDEIPKGEIDGYINLLFSEQLTPEQIATVSAKQEEAILYCYYENTKHIKELLLDIEKTNKVLSENKDDKIAKRELEKIMAGQKELLNYYIFDSLWNNSSVQWYWRGQRQSFVNKKEFINCLSQICSEIYTNTPVFKNELANKHRISPQINTARKQYFKALVNNWALPELGFEANKFPAEKTLYITLLRENNLATYVDETNRVLKIRRGSSFTALWNASIAFLNSARTEKKSIADFVAILSSRPFKLKQGLIDLWIPSFLFLLKEDFALFNNSSFIPSISENTLELIIKEPDEYFIKSFDIEGIKLDIFNSYRVFLDQETKTKLENRTFIETIKPFLTFYKGLKEYSKQSKRLSPEALAIRTAIATAQDPEQTFFEDFPNALGTSISELQADKEIFQSYITRLQNAIREIRTSYDGLVNRFEFFIQEEIVYDSTDFNAYRNLLQQRFKSLKKHLLIDQQIKFITRLDSQLDDRTAWLNALAQAVIDKPLDQIRDEDEILLYDKFKATILGLDSLTSLSSAHIDEEKEDVWGLQIDSFVDGIKRSLVRLPKKKNQQVTAIKNELKTKLSEDRMLNIAAIAALLKEMMNE